VLSLYFHIAHASTADPGCLGPQVPCAALERSAVRARQWPSTSPSWACRCTRRASAASPTAFRCGARRPARPAAQLPGGLVLPSLLGTHVFFTKPPPGAGVTQDALSGARRASAGPNSSVPCVPACAPVAARRCACARTQTHTHTQGWASDAPPARGAAWPTDDCGASYLLAVPAAVRAAHPARRQVRPRAAVAAALPAPQPHLSRALASTLRRGPPR